MLVNAREKYEQIKPREVSPVEMHWLHHPIISQDAPTADLRRALGWMRNLSLEASHGLTTTAQKQGLIRACSLYCGYILSGSTEYIDMAGYFLSRTSEL